MSNRYLQPILVIFFLFFAIVPNLVFSQENTCTVTEAVFRALGQSSPSLDLSNSEVINHDADGAEKTFVYLDVKTNGCENENLNIQIFGLWGPQVESELYDIAMISNMFNLGGAVGTASYVMKGEVSNDVSVVINGQEIISQGGDFSVAFLPGQGICYGANNPDCLVFAKIIDGSGSNILKLVGNLIGKRSLTEIQQFAQTYAPSTLNFFNANNAGTSSVTGGGCTTQAPDQGFYFQKKLSCLTLDFLGFFNFFDGYNSAFDSFSWDQRLREYYNGLGFNFSDEDGDYRAAFPGLRFECSSTFCSSGSWQFKGLIPYATNHPDDSMPVPVNSLPSNYETNYQPLAPLPFPGLDGGGTPNLATYLQGIFRMLLIVAVVLSVIMIVIAGFQYVASSANPQGKGDARKRLSGALIGLVLALGSWLLLDTVNPNFASNLSITIPKVSLDPDAPDPAFQGAETSLGTHLCQKGGHQLNGENILYGVTHWPNDALNRSTLSNAGINTSPSANCAGTNYPNSCTSLYFNSGNNVVQNVLNLKQMCDGASNNGTCNITLTGGSECWLHSSHGPGRRVVDIRSSDPAFNAWVVENASQVQSTSTSREVSPDQDGFPDNGKNYIIQGVGTFKAEYLGQYSQTSGKHWHVVFQ